MRLRHSGVYLVPDILRLGSLGGVSGGVTWVQNSFAFRQWL